MQVRPYFRGTQFLRIALFKLLVETILQISFNSVYTPYTKFCAVNTPGPPPPPSQEKAAAVAESGGARALEEKLNAVPEVSGWSHINTQGIS